jgi:hypothetical protein
MNRLKTNVTRLLAPAPALMANPKTPHSIYAEVS